MHNLSIVYYWRKNIFKNYDEIGIVTKRSYFMTNWSFVLSLPKRQTVWEQAAKDECNNGGAGAVHVLAGIHPNGAKHTQNPCFGTSRSAVTLPAVVAEKQHFSPRFQHLQHQTSHASSSVYPPRVASPVSNVASELAGIDWGNLGFEPMNNDYMLIMKCVRGEGFSKRELRRFGNIELSPSAGVLNYGQGLFEGLKAYRKHDGNILLFRPEENAMRLQMGADRLCMPCPTVDQFVEAVKDTVLANERWIPPLGKGSLYVRPLLMGSGAVLGVAPAPEYTFLIYVSPVGNYFKEGLAPINLIVENEMHRATPGGTGGVKAIGNYSAVLKAHSAAKAKGYSDVLYLDSVHKRYLEEVSTCNVFVVKGNIISTPAVEGTILPGITRKSIVDVARSQGFKVEERLVAVDELLEADEVFCTGTAVVVSPVGSITYLDKKVTYGINGVGPVSQRVYYALTSLQMGLVEDKMGWMVELKLT